MTTTTPPTSSKNKSAKSKTVTSGSSTSGPRRAASPKVDPRIEARRSEVKREENQRKLRTIGALVALSVLVIGVLYILDSGLTDVDDFQVIGSVHSDPADVIAATGIVAGDPLVELDIEGAEEAVVALPWVESVTVDRNWRGTVTVEITEREPVVAISLDPTSEAAAAYPGGFMLIDQSGRQLAVSAERPASFMAIAGVSASGVPGAPTSTTVGSVIGLSTAMTPPVAEQVTQIIVDGPDFVLELAQGGRVRLGADAGLDDKMVALETLLTHVDLRCLWEVDLRVPSAPAVTRINADGIQGAMIEDLAQCL